ncbi:MAG TPA: hypothetical protein VFI77_08255 [Gemmatimonadales bacterium]|nr:hypothetical protein [Gemmatimonadales bacterium]
MALTRWILPVLLLLPAVAAAQSEAALKTFFEGRSVTLKLAMPGTESGVDIYPADPKPLDYPHYAERLKQNGTAIRSGEQAMVTKVRVKGTHVEFQLDGGGYGTMGDETSPTVAVPVAEKTKREKNLEADLKRETDPDRRRDIKEELDDLRDDREREDARNRAEVADAQEQKKESIRQRRLEGGSRFNVRFRDSLPASMLTPAGLQAVLADYVTFERADGAPLLAGMPTTAAPATGSSLPRKGMTTREMEALLGAAVDSTERKEGALTVITRTYRSGAGRIAAEFVEDVLIRYSITSE